MNARNIAPPKLRVAMVSLHTSPLDQPGIGDAGGLNVYVADLARSLQERGLKVDIFTRATARDQPARHVLTDGVVVHHVAAGPRTPVGKDDLITWLPAFVANVAAKVGRDVPYGLLHSHYWLSGRAAQQLAGQWDLPLVHTMHTLARTKNLALGPGESSEGPGRLAGEQTVAGAADALLANTNQEAEALIELYGVPPSRVHTVPPGVDTRAFAPGDRDLARAELDLHVAEPIVLFVGRIQPHKAPDVLIRALGLLRERGDPVPRLVVLGGPSGASDWLSDLKRLAKRCDVTEHITFRSPAPRHELPSWYRAADLVAMPSRSETFGLVAAEAQASGTPVLAADVGGLPAIVADGISGRLVAGHEPQQWAVELSALLNHPGELDSLARGARDRRETFTSQTSVAGVLEVYRAVLDHHRVEGQVPVACQASSMQ